MEEAIRPEVSVLTELPSAGAGRPALHVTSQSCALRKYHVDHSVETVDVEDLFPCWTFDLLHK